MNKRFALLQITFSVVALAGVVWWALHQEAPRFPSDPEDIAWILAAVGLYAIATVVRAERWHRILELVGVRSARSDCYALTTVGYMGNNVLPARAGEMLRVVLLDARVGAGKRKLLGTIVAERLLDVIILGVMFVGLAYGVLAGRKLLPDKIDHPALIVGIVLALVLIGYIGFRIVRAKGMMTRIRDFIRPLAGPLRSLLNKSGLAMLAVTGVLWLLEGTVYLAVARAVDLDISASGALYLVALTNFVAALPAAPGSIGTFDAAVAFGARALGGTGGVVVSYLLLLRFVLYVPITAVGLIVMLVRYGGLARVRSAMRVKTSAPSA